MDIEPYWIDGPVTDDLKHLQQGELAAVWNKRYGHAGKPDLVANIGGVNTVVEFKTSDQLWQSHYRFKDFANYQPYFKYAQAQMQIAAYGKAFSDTTKIPIEAGIIINAIRDEGQLFIVDKPDLKKSLTKFHKLAKKFLS